MRTATKFRYQVSLVESYAQLTSLSCNVSEVSSYCRVNLAFRERVLILVTPSPSTAAIAKYIIASCESAELEQSHLEILLLLPKEYMDRSTKRKIVTVLSSQSNTIGDSNTMLALLKYTRDDPGNPLVSDFLSIMDYFSLTVDPDLTDQGPQLPEAVDRSQYC